MPGLLKRNTANFNAHVLTWIGGGGNNPGGFAMAPSFIGVIDVGQGSTNVVFNASGQAIVYFDLGGGAGGSNRSTFPDCGNAQLGPRLCVAARPRFVLSHWDWDHWRGTIPAVGTRALGVVNATAIAAGITANTEFAAMRQGLSPLDRAIRRKLKNITNFYQREDVGGAQLHNVGAFRVIRCAYNNAHGGADNNTGFALRIEDPGNAGQFILLPGDAHWPNIQAHGCDNNLVGLVATHHGEPTVQAEVPRPLGGAGGNRPIVYSFGPANKYGHAREPDGVTPYANRNYNDAQRMQTAGRHGASPNFGPRGNVALKFASTPAGPGVAPGNIANQLRDAAIAILASAATAASVASQGGNLTAAQIGHIAAAAAYQATLLSGQAHAAAVALEMTAIAAGMPAQTPLEVRAAVAGVPAAELAQALTEAPAACASVLTAGPGCQDYLEPVGWLMARAYSLVAVDLTTVVNSVAAHFVIQTRATRAAGRVYAQTRHGPAIAGAAGTLGGHADATAISNAVGGPNPPLA
ncbi:MAG TPA: hypothetical protein VJ276_00935, partial [Thermoanaerobaculia bacterium]|nr:hypothetical protein [Thermoanaerobaculia bacterium]